MTEINTAQDLLDRAGAILESSTPTSADLSQAEADIESVLYHDLDNHGVWFMLASCYMRQNRWATAYHWMTKVVEQDPEMVEALNNLGYIEEALGRREKSIELFRRAHKLRPDDPALCNNVATPLINNGTPGEALKATNAALKADPDFVDAHWNRGLALLELGKWKKGWEEYRWGLKLTGTSTQQRKIRHYREEGTTPWWEGTAGKSVVIYSEQGVGDEILAASMLPDAIKDADVTFESHPRLVNIMRHSFPEIPIYGTRKHKWKDLAFPAWTKIDAKCAIFDLGGFYRNSADAFPRTAYLKPYKGLVDEYKTRMGEFSKPRIGIAWQGGSVITRVDLRSIPLGQWLPILKSVDAEWISLQYDPAEKPGAWAPIIEEFNTDTGVNLHHWEEDVNDLDLCYGGLIHSLDLIISINTSVVHACGAYGVNCWTLTPSRPAWRYGVEGNHIPWYGDWVRQIRQKGDSWDSALTTLHKDLLEWAEEWKGSH